MFERYDPAAYAVGDPIYLQVPDGWNEYAAVRYFVTKKTPSGQIVAEDNGRTIRVTARGSLSGESGYGRSTICSEKRALELRARKRVREAWYRIVAASDKLERAARSQDRKRLEDELAVLAAAVQALRDSDGSPQGGDAESGSVHDSAGPSGHRPETRA